MIIGLLVRTDLDIDTHQLRQHDAGLFRRFHPDHYINLVTGRNLAVSAVNSVVFATCATAFADHQRHPRLAHRADPDAPLKALPTSQQLFAGNTYILYVTAHGFTCWGAPGRSTISIAHGSSSTTPFNVNSLTGMILIEGSFSPLVFLLLSSTFHAANADMRKMQRGCPRLHSRYDPADFDEACPSGAVCARAVCFHTKHRGIRGPRVGRDARPGRCLTTELYQKHQGSSTVLVTQVRFQLSC
jgi:hypothetical protein